MPISEAFPKLVEAVRQFAPELVESLARPATSAELGTLQNYVPHVPPELLELLSVHNGESSNLCVLPCGAVLMSTKRIIERVAEIRELNNALAGSRFTGVFETGETRGPVRPIFASPDRVPFAELNGGDITLYLDMIPAKGGKKG